MSRVAPASRSVLSEQVKDRLLHAILSGRFPPGARIVETQVARELGVSQAPVREALRDLGALGIVEINAFRGARVRRPAADELLEAFVVREALDSMGVRLAVPRLAEADIDELEGRIQEMQQAADAGDSYAEANADAAFHRRIIEIAGNGTLERVWLNLEPFSRTHLTLEVATSYGNEMVDLHRPVLEAFRQRDVDRADAAIRRHFVNAAGMLRQTWSEGASWPSDHPAPAEPVLGGSPRILGQVAGTLAASGRGRA